MIVSISTTLSFFFTSRSLNRMASHVAIQPHTFTLSIWERLREHFSSSDSHGTYTIPSVFQPRDETETDSIISFPEYVDGPVPSSEPALSRIVSQPALHSSSSTTALLLGATDPTSQSPIRPSKGRRRAATDVLASTLYAPFKRGSLAFTAALAKTQPPSASVTSCARKVPKIVLADPDGRSQTIYLKE